MEIVAAPGADLIFATVFTLEKTLRPSPGEIGLIRIISTLYPQTGKRFRADGFPQPGPANAETI